ncbi:MAG: response regulator [Acidobacteria bacterium]|nr:response regulator [Acidobacteriota bacterium]
MALIAIVDDSRLARTFSAAALKKLGHETVEIEPLSVFAVLAALKERKPDLLVVDFLMPGCPGQSVVRGCHEDPDLKDLKIVLLTAHREEEAQQRLENLGVQKVLHKPVDPKVLEEAVAALLGA